MVATGITSEYDAAFALLSEHINSDDVNMKTAAIVG